MPTAEHIKAKQWRERMGLSYEQLAELTGYSALTIRWMEKGVTPPRSAAHIAGKQKSRPIPWYNWQRYKNICAAVDARLTLQHKFEW